MTFRRTLAAAVRLATAVVLLGAPFAAVAQASLVAAAADLKFALAELAKEYERTVGRGPRLAFGSSGSIAQQIENGAPFELFLSADEAYVERLHGKGLTRGEGALYAIGRLALFVPDGSPLKPDPTLADLRTAVADGRLRRFAIANPEVAPYGRAAREVLQARSMWDAIRPMLVLGENASQAMHFAASADAQGGIVPSALAKVPDIARRGTSVLLPDSLHKPLRQRMVLLKSAGKEAEQFYGWLQTPAARRIFLRHGFGLPGE